MPAAGAAARYLSDLPFTLAGAHYYSSAYSDGVRVNGHGTIRTENGSQAYDWPGPLKVAGTTYADGLTFRMIHSGSMSATWMLHKRYSKLTALIGLDDNQDIPGVYPEVTVKFVGDGKVLGTASFASVYGQPVQTPSVTIPLTGVNALKIAVTLGNASDTDLDVINPLLQ